MKLSFICPQTYCEALHEMQDFYLLLPHISLKDKEYSEFFKNTPKYKIMDNSAHELGGSLPFEQVVEEALRLNCQEIVLPDYKFDMKKTLDGMEKAFTVLQRYNEATKLKIHAVPQGSNSAEYMECYGKMSSLEEIAVIGLAFRVVEKCFKNVTGLPGVMPNRLFLTDLLAPLGPEKEHHLLGLGNVLELFFQKRHSWIRSNDSTKQIKYAMAGVPFDEYGCSDKVEGLLDFDKSYDEEVLEETVKNILVTLKITF
jgi:hypothetical protein